MTQRRRKEDDDQLDRLLWSIVFIVVVIMLFKKQDGTIPEIAGIVLYLLLPQSVLYRGDFRNSTWLRLDLVALIPFAVVHSTWAFGFSIIWRWLILLSSVSSLRVWAAKATADYALVLIFLSPIAAELSLRNTYLMRAWSPEQLKRNTDDSEEFLPLGWKGTCGPEPTRRTIKIAYSGGSSTGGAYQFKGEPESFFPAQAHIQLCAHLPDQTRLESYKF